jgi:hypothetical protein
VNPDNVAVWTLESWIVQHDEPGALPATAEPPAAV